MELRKKTIRHIDGSIEMFVELMSDGKFELLTDEYYRIQGMLRAYRLLDLIGRAECSRYRELLFSLYMDFKLVLLNIGYII